MSAERRWARGRTALAASLKIQLPAHHELSQLHGGSFSCLALHTICPTAGADLHKLHKLCAGVPHRAVPAWPDNAMGEGMCYML